MKKIFTLTILISALVSFGQSKKEQIEILNSRVDSLKVVINNERQNFDIALDSLNQVLGKTQQYFEIEIANYSIKINNLNTQIDNLISINDSINLQLKIKNQNIDSLILQKLELLADIDSLSIPRIDNEESEFLSLFSGKRFSRGIDESEEFIVFTPYEECADAFVGSYWADGPSLKIYTINFEEKELVLVGISDCTNAMGFGYRLKYIDKNTISVIPMCCESDLNCDDAFFGFFNDLRGNPCNSFLLSN
tara:strand:- start:48 stop:797 length:750 start_codon:yes stop_codon:yes gene_type:complete